jgi:hypothetical protein
MDISKATVRTEHATSYLRQLCRHWSHRFPVEFNDEAGTIQLPQAECTLTASPTELTVTLELRVGADRERVQKVVEEHLQRFGFRETLVFEWNNP